MKTICHEQADRVPIDLGAHFSTGISVFAYKQLREYLGLSTDRIEMADCVQCLARVDDDILDRFHVDTALVNPSWPLLTTWNPRDDHEFLVPVSFQPKIMQDGAWQMELDGRRLIMPAGGFFFDGGWPDFYRLGEDEKLEIFSLRSEKLYKEQQRFTIFMGFNGFFTNLDFACDMLTDPNGCKEVNQARLENQIERFDRINKKMGQYLGAIELNSDLGIQSGPMCTPGSYEEICYPYLKAFCEHVHKTSDIKVFMHSCGSIWELMDYITDAGVDALNPVQISADGMDPKRLKECYGNKICFWGGGCDTQNVLWKQSPGQVASHVEELINIFKPGGGYVFTQVHNIMGNVPPENIVAMLDTAYANSFY